jgi:hypothetical protein
MRFNVIPLNQDVFPSSRFEKNKGYDVMLWSILFLSVATRDARDVLFLYCRLLGISLVLSPSFYCKPTNCNVPFSAFVNIMIIYYVIRYCVYILYTFDDHCWFFAEYLVYSSATLLHSFSLILLPTAYGRFEVDNNSVALHHT